MAHRPATDWTYTARLAVESLSRVRDGDDAVVLLPVDIAGIAQADLLRMVRAYNSDILAAHVPIMEDTCTVPCQT